jgi:MYXO-CTERM domain-containing protein
MEVPIMDAATVTTITVLALLALAVLAVAFARRRRAAPRSRRTETPRPSQTLEAVDGRITLEVPADDVDDAALRRLATQLAERALDRDPALMVVEVVDLDGHNVLRLHRTQRPRTIELPEALHEPHVRPRRGPSPVPDGGRGGPRPPTDRDGDPTGTGREADTTTRVRPLGARPAVDRFALPDAVRARIAPDADHVSVLEAILSVAGHPTSRDGDLVLLPHMAFIVVNVRDDGERALSRAYLRLERTGRAHGIVIRQGYVDPAVLARRQRSAPDVVYTDTRALQRMADAVALGLNPLDFIQP